MSAMPEFEQLQLRFVDHVQWRYELIRPVVLIKNRTAAQRAVETHTHPETVRHLTRRFRQQGTLGLFPEHTQIISPSRGKVVPEAVVEELARRRLYDYQFALTTSPAALEQVHQEFLRTYNTTAHQGLLKEGGLGGNHCRYNWQTRQISEVRDGVFYATRFASPQGAFLPLNPQESLVLYRPRAMMHQTRLVFPAQQSWLFELVQTA